MRPVTPVAGRFLVREGIVQELLNSRNMVTLELNHFPIHFTAHPEHFLQLLQKRFSLARDLTNHGDDLARSTLLLTHRPPAFARARHRKGMLFLVQNLRFRRFRHNGRLW